MHKLRRLLLPGLFLLILGIGNISVGSFKERQYAEVVQELESSNSGPELVHAAPLRRIQLARRTANRLFERQEQARAKAYFYSLVSFGGKVFLGLSLPFFLLGILPNILGAKPQDREI